MVPFSIPYFDCTAAENAARTAVRGGRIPPLFLGRSAGSPAGLLTLSEKRPVANIRGRRVGKAAGLTGRAEPIPTSRQPIFISKLDGLLRNVSQKVSRERGTHGGAPRACGSGVEEES
jgi:hypothetical protein